MKEGEDMARKLTMSFVTSLGGRSSIALDEPKTGLTGAEVRTVMETVISNNLFNTTKGDISAVKAAEIVTTTKETLI